MSDWKPGDVALVKNEWGVWNVAICAVRATHRGFVWSYGVADSVAPLTAEARPLAVIDPEDTEQVNRLADKVAALEHADCGSLSCYRDRVAVALREFTTPKPEEPGLYAVVLDGGGGEWVRVRQAPGAPPWRLLDGGPYTAWADVDAVRVLSEGVTA